MHFACDLPWCIAAYRNCFVFWSRSGSIWVDSVVWGEALYLHLSKCPVDSARGCRSGRSPGVTRWAKYAWKAVAVLPGAGRRRLESAADRRRCHRIPCSNSAAGRSMSLMQRPTCTNFRHESHRFTSSCAPTTAALMCPGLSCWSQRHLMRRRIIAIRPRSWWKRCRCPKACGPGWANLWPRTHQEEEFVKRRRNNLRVDQSRRRNWRSAHPSGQRCLSRTAAGEGGAALSWHRLHSGRRDALRSKPRKRPRRRVRQAAPEPDLAERTDEEILAELDLPDPDQLEAGRRFHGVHVQGRAGASAQTCAAQAVAQQSGVGLRRWAE